ncbi:hypothetical protein HG535_0E05520 [Zygotorulaspora mrakii]|uniref:K Homology domain-containing protein n=1 Tax=Zygotorulaspora mrakii TaxID=42260 RepID=A0A7H9B461_ZYGMR|nr:uncharacterized protein HG535_0E05520 [Zygotorulaspora mrakii]QLG73468.1 hypothetical protein HG535_0E05520 [Zygotorulaspora mrakii]
MSIQVLNEICTFVFCEVPNLYMTGRLWRSVGDELGHPLPSNRAIYDVPEDTLDFQIKASRYCANILVLRGVTKSGYHEPMTSVTLPFRTISNNPAEDVLLLEELKQGLFDLAEELDIEIIVTENQIYNPSPITGRNSFYINLIGIESQASTAYLHLWSLVELYQRSKSAAPSTFIDCLNLDAYSLLPTVVGVEMANIKHISTTYKTEIHIPSLLSPLESKTATNKNMRPQIFFSGPIHSMVLAAKDATLKTVKNLNSSLYYKRFSNISPQKLLYLRKHYQPELNRLMIKYQSFIRATHEFVEFQSPCPALLESVIKVFTINVLHQIAEIQITLKENFIFSSELLSSICLDESNNKIILATTGTHSNQLLIVGNHSELTPTKHSNQFFSARGSLLECVIKIVSALPEDSLSQLKAIFEIHVDYEDFISGKKNGKITRIMETIPCLIKLEKLEEDDSIFLSLFANSLNNFAETFSMVINELPAEESFFIPEIYHRPVIGAGGSVIQATMKKYNVFVRFSNSFFLPQSELCHVRYDNVIIRCPFKNVSSISSAKSELNQLAREYGRSQPRALIKFTPGQYRYMLSLTPKGSQAIGNIEKKHNVYVMFPFVEPSEGYLLEIRGNDDAAYSAAKDLVDSSFGLETELHLNKELDLNEEFYNFLVFPFKHTMKIEISAHKNLLRMTYQEGNLLLNKAFTILASWFKSKDLEVVGKEVVRDFVIKSKNPESLALHTPSPNSKTPPEQVYQVKAASILMTNLHDTQYFQPSSTPHVFHTSLLDDRKIMHPYYTKVSTRNNGWT